MLFSCTPIDELLDELTILSRSARGDDRFGFALCRSGSSIFVVPVRSAFSIEDRGGSLSGGLIKRFGLGRRTPKEECVLREKLIKDVLERRVERCR